MVLKSLILLFLLAKTSYGGLYANSSAIINLNTENFNSLVKDAKEIWVVEFFAPWCKHCKDFEKEYERAAKALTGIVKIGAVNAEENPSLAEKYDVQEYPTIKIFNSHKGTPHDYQGDHTASALVSFVSVELHSKINSRLDGNLNPSMFKAKEIEELTETNFDELVLSTEKTWLVVYYSPFSEKCEKLSSKWIKIAAQLTGMLKFGALNSILHFDKASDSKIEGYPTIKFFPLGKKKVSSGITYNGKLTEDGIVLWTLEKLSDHAPNPEITQIIDFATLKRVCEYKPLCIVTVLPSILDCPSNCRNDYLDTINDVGEKNKRTLWGWVWTEAGAQPGIENALNITEKTHPTIIAVNVKKMYYSVFTGSPSFEGINKFVQDLSYGRAPTKQLKVKAVPDVKNVEPWDGLSAPTEKKKDFDEVETRDEL